MSLLCPSCGHQGFDPSEQCVCGYQEDGSFNNDSPVMESGEADFRDTKGNALENLDRPKSGKPVEKHVIKKIDSWVFSYSQKENCIAISTPALQAFRLKLTLSDLEELLDFMYQKTGREKTTRKLRVSVEDTQDLIEKVNVMIEEKKSKIAVKFSDDELQKIVDLVNTKLKT